MRSKYDEQLSLLNTEVIKMGALCENAIASAAKALLDGEKSLAKSVKAVEERIDQKERDIESICMRLILQQQPVARDLRVVSSALKLITDMERIGDQSADIADIVLQADICAPDDALHIREMAQATISMVTNAVDAFVKQDTTTAHLVIKGDDRVDELFNIVKATLTEKFKNGGDMEFALDILMIAKYFERIGDHAVNIAEWVIFSVCGSKGD